ncbi:MAG: urea ABC transporter ATP-binding subunit UrtE [Oscillospiraceae bacterium]|jgi:urea transport system ATP-binding protein|nr:urea ABC transporter ATP-binding subunit UrtE [Oscillospiraceae bacterium]MCI2035499.1 urea ABC transporter ATP-binding subunit UrtE [Oscillospiraceae bacterium]
MLVLDRVQVNYGKSRAVTGVSFSLDRGRRLAVLGRNGVGKTTLLKSIMGVLPLAGGSIMWNGRDVSALRPHERCRLGMAYVPQGREILPGFTVRGNLELGCLAWKDKKRAGEQMERMLSYFPALRENLGRLGGLLSGGQQQQLAVARALMTSPELLLLDEPTEGIQPNVVDAIGRILKRICGETALSVVLVEQNLDFARSMTDDFIILQKGAVVCSGKTETLDPAAIKQFLSV